MARAAGIGSTTLGRWLDEGLRLRLAGQDNAPLAALSTEVERARALADIDRALRSSSALSSVGAP